MSLTKPTGSNSRHQIFPRLLIGQTPKFHEKPGIFFLTSRVKHFREHVVDGDIIRRRVF